MISFFDHFPAAGRTSLSASVISKSLCADLSINDSRFLAISFIPASPLNWNLCFENADRCAEISGRIKRLPGSGRLFPKRPCSLEEVAVQAGNVFQFDALWARRLALPHISAGAKEFILHLRHHVAHAPGAFRLSLGQQGKVRNLCRGKEHGGGV